MWQQQGGGQPFNYWQQYGMPTQVPANVPGTVTKPGNAYLYIYYVYVVYLCLCIIELNYIMLLLTLGFLTLLL